TGWWLEQYGRKATGKQKSGYVLPERFRSALRRIESATYDYCRYGRQQDLQMVLVGLGRAEGELALTDGHHRGNEICQPLAGLSPEWLAAAHDRSAEFEIALALAGIHDQTPQTNRNIGPIRCNLEPVAVRYWQTSWIMADKQKQRDEQSNRHVVWRSADLSANMAAVLERRILDGTRASSGNLPIDFKRGVSLDAIALFIAGGVDDRRIEDLLRGLMLIDHRQKYPEGLTPVAIGHASPLPREYALLKLLYLPRPLVRQCDGDYQRWKWRLARTTTGSDGKTTQEEGLAIRPEPRVLPLLRGGRVNEACRIAYQRLRASGLSPLPGPTSSGVCREADWEPDPSVKPERLAGALFLPVGDAVVNQLIQMVTRQADQSETESLNLAPKGAN
ncbi:MAG: type I-U CRISPR-associated protein Csx17, partial [bacterium]